MILQLKLLQKTGSDKGTNEDKTIVALVNDSKNLSVTSDSKLVNFSEFVNFCYDEKMFDHFQI